VSRLDAARRTAEQRERETQIRLDLTTRLMAGEDPQSVVAGAADALVALFGLVDCRVSAPGVLGRAQGPGAGGTPLVVRISPLEVELTPDHERPLRGSDRALLEALVAGLATAIDRLRLEAEAREARIDAQVGRTRSGFLSAVTHNLRTPLASIKAASSTLRMTDLPLSDDDRNELLDTIHDETERLERLVTNILELSRIRAGALDVRRQPVDLRDLAYAAVRRLRPLARAHRVRLDVPIDLGDVEVDVEMMEQVFGNLLENALRFAPPGSEILVSARCAPAPDLDGPGVDGPGVDGPGVDGPGVDGPGVEVRVADHGPGVPEAERTRIFEEFARVDARPDATGTGLGLAIVHALVTAHGGQVWCEETPGGGATFVFVLPARRVDAVREARA
jgi:two-component system sensor histidine kinase KdpD